MALTTTTAAVAITFVTPPTDDAVLMRFYQRVRPIGFWGVTARAAGHSARAPATRLGAGLRAAGITAASLFLLLYGIGGTLIPSDHRPLARTLIALLLGLALVPVWWRLLEPAQH
jgi:solute:Na+ symporter, SSS family